MKKKIHFGKKTMKSLELQITSILASLNRSEVRIDRIKPIRHDIGNFVCVTYHTVAEPEVQRSRYFAHQKVRECCDVWLESPPEINNDHPGSNAA
jgi:hypothetical protein